jgi:soluble lytic murein transglycosylase-like protein
MALGMDSQISVRPVYAQSAGLPPIATHGAPKLSATLTPLAAAGGADFSWPLPSPSRQAATPSMPFPGTHMSGGQLPGGQFPSLLTPSARAFAAGRLQQQSTPFASLSAFGSPLGGAQAGGAQAGWPGTGSPGQQCRRAIANAERLAGIPQHLLAAIARVESGRRDPQTGVVDPWPWSINVEGIDHIYETKDAAISAVRSFQSEGHRSIDVGCMQVNLLYHPDAFTSLEQAFDPRSNAEYGARFLTELYRQTGTWEHATANYHSATPELGDPYQRKVMAALPEEQRTPTPGGFSGGVARMASLTMNPPSSLTPVSMPSPPGGSAMGLSHVLPMPGLGTGAAGAGSVIGRGLDSYRARPITLARR